MEKAYLLLDVGGTQIKAGISDEQGSLSEKIFSFPSMAKAGTEELLEHFAAVISSLQGETGDAWIAGVGMAFPGPFDYGRGISLMRGLDKYDSIYGISLEKEMKRRAEAVRDSSFKFLHDVEAFALGESRFGEARKENKLLCLCIGTGIGSAFVEGGRVLKEQKHGVPLNGWLYHTPYKDSTLDDYLSVRGLAKISRQITGKILDGKMLYERCAVEEAGALQVYHAFGQDLSAGILPFVDAFHPDAVVFGGQISGSFPYFGESFQEECRMRGVKIYLEPKTSVRAMQGLFAAMEQEGAYAEVKS